MTSTILKVKSCPSEAQLEFKITQLIRKYPKHLKRVDSPPWSWTNSGGFAASVDQVGFDDGSVMEIELWNDIYHGGASRLPWIGFSESSGQGHVLGQLRMLNSQTMRQIFRLSLVDDNNYENKPGGYVALRSSMCRNEIESCILFERYSSVNHSYWGRYFSKALEAVAPSDMAAFIRESLSTKT